MLDSPQACISELADINNEIQQFGHLWATYSGELKERLTRLDRVRRAALLGITEKLTVPEKEATTYAAVETTSPGLLEEIEELEGKVEQNKILFKTLERRSSNAQSILSALRAERQMGEFSG